LYLFNGNADDGIGNNNGQVYGATLTEDRFGKSNSSFNFDGNDRIVIDNFQCLNQTFYFSLNLWVKFDSLSGDHFIMDKRNNSISDNVINLGLNDGADDNGSIGSLYFKTFDLHYEHTSISYTASNLNTKDWYMITSVYIDKTMLLYVNGQLVKQAVAKNSLNSNNASLWIGGCNKNGDYNYFQGIIDDIRIYNRQISESEIQQLYIEGTQDPIIFDEDDDGVPDQWDECKNTPHDSWVNKNGCHTDDLRYSEKDMLNMVNNLLKWDIDKDQKIGLIEVLHILKESAGESNESIK